MIPAIPITVSKVDAIRLLAAANGIAEVNPWAQEIGQTLAELTAANTIVPFASATACGIAETPVFPAIARHLSAPMHLTSRPDSFPAAGIEHAQSPALRRIDVMDGVYVNLSQAPLVMAPNGTGIADYSSRYARLAGLYDIDLVQLAADAPVVDGPALVLSDEIHPVNFCHWLVDWLPRLACLGAQLADCHVIVNHPPTLYQRDTLALCGIAPERIRVVDEFHALRACMLIATSDLAALPHPAFKAAPWALDFLRARIGFPALAQTPATAGQKIYISRDDAAGRRIANDGELAAALAARGYRRVVLSDMPVAAQIATIARASHVVALHGAGLALLALSGRACSVVEIFPRTYGTPAFYVLAAGLGNRYATYVAGDIVPGCRDQLDDVRVDVADFLTRAAPFL